jgi:hypothetical protein
MTQKNLTTSERPCAEATSKLPPDYQEFTLSLLWPFENVGIRLDPDPKITTICAAFFPVVQPRSSNLAAGDVLITRGCFLPSAHLVRVECDANLWYNYNYKLKHIVWKKTHNFIGS